MPSNSVRVKICHEVKLLTAVTSWVVIVRDVTIIVGVGRLRRPHAVEMSLEANFSISDNKRSARFAFTGA